MDEVEVTFLEQTLCLGYRRASAGLAWLNSPQEPGIVPASSRKKSVVFAENCFKPHTG